MNLIANYLRVCELAARAGGQVLRDYAGRVTAREKGPADLVTEADVASQRAVRDVLLGTFPDHGFLAEENESIPPGQDNLRWIVDPLDGTTNYVHGIPQYAVSIGLEQNGALLAGAVYDPCADDMFLAGVGQGASLNGRRLAVSGATELSKAVVAVSFPPRVERDAPQVGRFREVLVRARATRRTGSTALNLCWIAAGRFDAYWSYSTKSWDVAAGILMLREAGGVATGPGGCDFCLAEASFVAAASPSLHSELLRVLALVAD